MTVTKVTNKHDFKPRTVVRFSEFSEDDLVAAGKKHNHLENNGWMVESSAWGCIVYKLVDG